GLIAWDFHVSPDLNPSNRPVRTRMPGGVAGVRSMKAVPYADCALPVKPSRAIREQAGSHISGTHFKCGSGLAREGGVSNGARLELRIPVQVQKCSKNQFNLYPVHHLIS
ncbi:hypothetical protein, partial [Pseudomonas sp. GL-B-12]|uniref:hypothetical protein n=1 Tax=Pseudomonas sp. GL-B-12 TaxID=2832374 RepID=UPI001CC04BDF